MENGIHLSFLTESMLYFLDCFDTKSFDAENLR